MFVTMPQPLPAARIMVGWHVLSGEGRFFEEARGVRPSPPRSSPSPSHVTQVLMCDLRLGEGGVRAGFGRLKFIGG